MKQSVDLLIVNGTIVTINQQRSIIEHGAVAITHNKISAVGPSNELEQKYVATHTIDATDQIIMPGLVNGHTHAALSLMRGRVEIAEKGAWLKVLWSLEKSFINAESVFWGSYLAGLEMLRGGITTAADMYYFQSSTAAAFDELGLRALVGETYLDQQFSPLSYDLTQSDASFEKLFETYQNHPRIYPALAPHAPYSCSPQTLAHVAALAKKTGCRMLMHVAETIDENNQTSQKSGKRPLAYLAEAKILDAPITLMHGIYLEADEQKELAQRGIGIISNPQSNLKLRSGIAPLNQLIAAGCAVGLGTDSATSNNSLNLFAEIKTALLLHQMFGPINTLTPHDILVAATLGGARALGLGNEIGSLEVGKKADLILIARTEPHHLPHSDIATQLVYATDRSDVDTVIIDGSVVMQHRQLTTTTPQRLADLTDYAARIAQQNPA
jgi:5-methylthioadenosine/S-adenosylhomocysteine deaminase